ALPNTFWAFVDDKLNDRRKEALKLPEDERKAHISRPFDLALKKHIAEFPPRVKKPKTMSLPPWQVELQNSVEEMATYNNEDLNEPISNANNTQDVPQDDSQELE
ncbi:hypothetical protein PLICRDRAFT_180584, partial [Plicaturopsis crispa FD-325 SS-3]